MHARGPSLVAALLVAAAVLVPVGSASAAPLTPWNNPYDGGAVVQGVHYTVRFVGAGKHEYRAVAPKGCRLRLAKQYRVSVFRSSRPDRILYSALTDGVHTLAASHPYDSSDQRFSSVRKLVRSVRTSVESSDERAAWDAGGDELVVKRQSALATDFVDQVAYRLTRYIDRRSEIVAAEQTAALGHAVEPYEVESMVDLSGLDLAAELKSTRRLYGSGCGADSSRWFTRQVAVTGNGRFYTLTETDVEDGITIGWERGAQGGRAFRVVDGRQVDFPSIQKAAFAPVASPSNR